MEPTYRCDSYPGVTSTGIDADNLGVECLDSGPRDVHAAGGTAQNAVWNNNNHIRNKYKVANDS